MSVSSISNISAIESTFKNPVKETESGTFIPFKDILNNAIENVKETDAVNRQNMINIATGQEDNLHTVMIDAAKAELALQTLVQLRNKALDAYNEIMRITL